MKYIIDSIVNLIIYNEPSKEKETMIRIDGFDELAIYEQVATKISNIVKEKGLTIDIRLAKNKYNNFKNSEDINTTILQSMEQHNWVATEASITYYRNLHKSDVVLLMGTEDEEDRGGLANCYSITPDTIVKTLNQQYHILFVNEFFTNEDNEIVDNLYKDLFEYKAIDICKLSNFADSWKDKYTNRQEFIKLFFSSLPEWGLPFRKLTFPKEAEIRSRKNILSSCYHFVSRQLFNNKMSERQYKKYIDQIDLYVKNDKAKYPSNHKCWKEQGIKSYDDFAKILKEFIIGDNILENQKKLLTIDYSIIEDVLQIPIPSTTIGQKSKVKTLIGSPLNVFLNALFTTFMYIQDDSTVQTIEFDFKHAEIISMYTGATDIDTDIKEQLANAWKSICIYCGGIIEFLNIKSWTINGSPIKLICTPESFFSPKCVNDIIGEEKYVKAASANKKINKITFSTSYVINGKKYSHNFQWKFDTVNSWNENFGDLCTHDFGGNLITVPYIPISEISNMNTLLFSKSEEEFFDYLIESDIRYDFNLVEYIKEKSSCDEKDVLDGFIKLGVAFSKFISCIKKNGFFSCIRNENSPLTELCTVYMELGELLLSRSFSEKLYWILDAYINAFNIIDDIELLKTESEIDCCIVPAWHPATLEKLYDQALFILDGCEEWWINTQEKYIKITESTISNMLFDIFQMCTIHNNLDLFPDNNGYIGCIASYGAYSLYGKNNIKNENRLSDMIHKDAIFDDDFDRKELIHFNDNAKMLYNIMLSYSKAFPDSADNLNIVFIDPSELQPIVAALYKYICCQPKNKKLNISLRILVKPENKGGRNYLAYWMNEFFSKDENVTIHTYLNEWSCKKELENLLNGNNDIAFAMNILKVNNMSFIPAGNNSSVEFKCKFPIVYKPAPVSKTTILRRIEISQIQFKVAYEHTQIVHYRKNPENIPAQNYIASKNVSININREGLDIVELLHQKAYWVACIDCGMDGALLKNAKTNLQKYNIIGFSTGNGKNGQYNITITARNTILDIIREKLENRLYSLFLWDKDQIKQAADLCMQEASHLDGISLLAATNPKDENIREFLAYVLTSLREKNIEQKSMLKIVIHLDSYKHWFNGNNEYSTNKFSSRPDFLILEAFYNNNDKLKLKATITECKLSTLDNADQHKKHAEEQVKNGLTILKTLFDPNSSSIKRKYWYAQLYRALAFAQITFSNDSEEFTNSAKKLRDVLNGNFEIEWNAQILGYWIDMKGEKEIINHNSYSQYDIPQKIIQSLLLHDDMDKFSFVNVSKDNFIEEEEYLRKTKKREELLEDEIAKVQSGKRTRDKYLPKNIDHQYLNDELQDDAVQMINRNSNLFQKQINISASEISMNDISKTKDQTSKNDKNVLDKVSKLPNYTKFSLDNVRVLIGKNKFQSNVYWEFGNPQMANRHLLITGTSGQGKTYSIQTMVFELAKSNISSVVFDYTEGFRTDQLDPEFINGMPQKIIQHVVKKQGVPINPFKKQVQEFDGMKIIDTSADVAGRFANILTHVYNFGDQQYAAIYEATRIGIEKYGDDMDINHFHDELLDIQSQNSSAKTVVSKMTPFFHSITFNKNSDFNWEDILYASESKMNIFQLTMIDREMQVIITELMLWDAWYYTKSYGSKEKPFVVVLDEAQNLSHKENSPSKAILTEGRKFGWSAWFATQSLKVLADDEVVRLMQAAFKLYFKPTDEEILKISKQLDPTNASLWLGALKALKKGQCIVAGDRQRDDGTFGSMQPVVTDIISFKNRD